MALPMGVEKLFELRRDRKLILFTLGSQCEEE